MKTPQEMSRIEIAELERELKALDDPVEENVPREQIVTHPEYIEYKKQIAALVPIRIGILRRYWDKVKMKKRSREEFLKAAEETESFLEGILEEDYVHFTDAIPEIKEFLIEHAKKEAILQNLLEEKQGTKMGDLVNLKQISGSHKATYSVNK